MDDRHPAQPVGEQADQQGMDLLAAHVPLSLLFDLTEDTGPPSQELLHAEPPSEADLAWLPAAH